MAGRSSRGWTESPENQKGRRFTGALPGLGCYRVAMLRSSPLRFIRTIHSESVYLLPMNFRRPRNGVTSRAMTHLAVVADRIDRSHTPRWWGGAGTGRRSSKIMRPIAALNRIVRETASAALYCAAPTAPDLVCMVNRVRFFAEIATKNSHDIGSSTLMPEHKPVCYTFRLPEQIL